MIAVVVQFIRNFCCVLKSLLPSTSPLQIRHEVISSFDATGGYSILEILIASTQFLAVLFNLYYGINDLLNGLKETTKLDKWIHAIDSFALSEGSINISSFVSLQSYYVTRQFIEKEKKSKEYQLIVGGWQIIFGISFMFLTLNTLRMITPKPVIDALIAMEIGLAYILVYMWDGFLEKTRIAGRQYYLATKIGAMDDVQKSSLLLTYLQEGGYDTNNIHKSVLVLEESFHPQWRNDLQESELPRETLVATFKSVSSLLDSLVEVKKKGDDSTKQSLLKKAESTYGLAFLDLIYFLLNFIAGHGYLMGILAFYLPTNNSYFIKIIFLGLSHSDADWWGNFAGDLAWTIEPVLVLLVAAITAITSTKDEKVKKD